MGAVRPDRGSNAGVIRWNLLKPTGGVVVCRSPRAATARGNVEELGHFADGLCTRLDVPHGGPRIPVSCLGHDELQPNVPFTEMCGSRVSELVEIPAVSSLTGVRVRIEQDTRAVVPQPRSSGVRTQVLGARAPRWCGTPVGEKDGATTASPEETRQQVRRSGAYLGRSRVRFCFCRWRGRSEAGADRMALFLMCLESRRLSL